MSAGSGLGGAELREAAALLRPTVADAMDADWRAPAGDIGLSVGETADHLSDALIIYATLLASRAQSRLPTPRAGLPQWTPAQLVTNVEVFADVLAVVVDAADDSVRVHHPFGRADPSGVAAMGMDEALVHTWDVATGLGVAFRPPQPLVRAVLERLFPWVTAEDRTLETLLWCNGRIASSGRERMHRWRWWAAPVAEWDGLTTGLRPQRARTTA